MNTVPTTAHWRRDYRAFCGAVFDAQNRPIAFDKLFTGTLTQTSVYPREIVRAALAHGAASVILAHNHPSGKVQPSRADRELTATLKAALALVDVRVLDHVIVAPNGALSMAMKLATLERNSFATPSPRLIPKGEKSDTFTDLAGIPNEGRT